MDIHDVCLRCFLRDNTEIDICSIALECGATSLLQVNHSLEQLPFRHKFNDCIVNGNVILDQEYRVVHVSSGSYILYEKDSRNIRIWVAYTKETVRRKGLMSMLLHALQCKYTCRTIEIHTHNESLKRLAASAQIAVLKL